MIPGGYILLARKTLESELFDKPPLWSKLWNWMLLRAEWRDDAKLARGQFWTNLEAMREAMSWHVGYRKMMPTVKETRSAYEGLREGEMIGVVKGVHGVLITILNYEKYQSPENYERRDEGRDERTTKGDARARYSKEVQEEKNKNKKKDISFVEGSIELRLATFLFNCIRKNRPEFKQPDLQTWAKHVDLMLRIDKREPEHVREVIKWAQADNTPRDGTGFCWAVNILSTLKLRKQFDQLAIKMEAAQSGKLGAHGEDLPMDLDSIMERERVKVEGRAKAS